MSTHRGSLLLITLLGLLFFVNLVLHPTQTLYSDCSDFFVLHLPQKHFLVHTWQETGQLPLWCPYLFSGLPFVHDIGASVFYPPLWPLFLVPEYHLGAAMSWLLVFHVIAAGWCMYAYAWHQGLRGASAVVAAVGYMLAGKWLLHLLAGGHYNMVPLAWLPLVLLWLEEALRRRSVFRATWAGVAFALILLGAFPYVTLYAGLFVALWTLGPVLEASGYLGGRSARSWRRTGKAVGRWVLLGLWTAVVAVALGAVQLLPALDVTAEASRSVGVGLSREFFMNGFRTLVGLVGPPLSDEPNCWENRAGLGILWVTLVALAPLLGNARVRFQTAILVVLVGFSLGGAALFQWLPGFRLFRLPSRMLLVAALPAALLAGKTLQTLLNASYLPLPVHRRCRATLVKITALVLLMAGAFGLTLMTQRLDLRVQFHPYWATLLLTLPCAYWLLGQREVHRETPGVEAEGIDFERLRQATWAARFPAWVWLALLVIDLGALTWPLVAVRPEAEIYAPSACVRYLADQRAEHSRVLDFNPQLCASNHTPVWPGLPMVQQIEAVRGFDPIDLLRYKEYLQFITDADQPLEAIDQMFTGPLVGTFSIQNQSLADLLGIRFLVQPSTLPLEETAPALNQRGDWAKVLDDPAPQTFNFISAHPSGQDGGVQKLPPYGVYENRGVLPRAFVVPEAAPLPDRPDVLAALKTTDFRRRVLLEGYTPLGEKPTSEVSFRPAALREYKPNQITLELDGGAPGYLVLTDIWFPGWTCTVDDQPVPVYRANFLFRAIELPAAARRVVFTFAPTSFHWGLVISEAAGVVVLALSLLALVLKMAATARVSPSDRKSHVVLR
jgi:hypothetical protein